MSITQSITQQPQPARLRRVWAQDVNVAVDVMETRLCALEAAEALSPAQRALDDGIRRRLAAARSATLRQDPVPGALGNWWRGTLVDAAYQNLHAAEAMMVGLCTPAEVDALIPEAVARVETGLDRDDPRRLAALQLLAADCPDDERRRQRLAKAIEVGFGAADAEYARLRNFRNTVLGGAATMAALLALFTVFVMRNPSDVPFCFAPGGGPEICASGSGPASGHDILTVVLLGSLGGLLAAILAIRNMRGTASPYNVPQALALLKLPLGAVSAIGALIAIRGGFIPGFSDIDSQEQILAYAFVFGLAQQLLTGLVDKQARTILTGVPGKANGTTRPERHLGTARGAAPDGSGPWSADPA